MDICIDSSYSLLKIIPLGTMVLFLFAFIALEYIWDYRIELIYLYQFGQSIL